MALSLFKVNTDAGVLRYSALAHLTVSRVAGCCFELILSQETFYLQTISWVQWDEFINFLLIPSSYCKSSIVHNTLISFSQLKSGWHSQEIFPLQAENICIQETEEMFERRWPLQRRRTLNSLHSPLSTLLVKSIRKVPHQQISPRTEQITTTFLYSHCYISCFSSPLFYNY